MKMAELNASMFEEMGYTHVKYINNVGWCGIMGMIYTYGVMLDMTNYCIDKGRICFSDYSSAILFLDKWDGTRMGVPNVGDNGVVAHKFINLV